MTFLAMDGNMRTDFWLNNQDEVTVGSDPWDSDTDDDGLTDGWEYSGSVEVQIDPLYSSEGDRTVEFNSDFAGTDPMEPDSDSDGYWDGWIGVYGTNYTDNVVLYREHLESGDGIEGDEIVTEQTDLHHVADDAPGTDIDGDEAREHSNVHIGERQWGTDPTDGDPPNLGVGVEADFVDGLPENRLDNEEWVTTIEENYALYGITLQIERDDTISGSLDAVTDSGDENQDLYLLVGTTRAGSEDVWGFNADASAETTLGVPSNAHLIWANAIASSAVDDDLVSSSDVVDSPYDSRTEVLAGFVEMHELGHSFDIGRADDSGALPLGEVYSGSSSDPTPERDQRFSGTRWSVMRGGWDSNTLFTHDDHSYYVFSIEELSTISEP